jgi:transposase
VIHVCIDAEGFMARYDLSDEEWQLVEPLLPKPGKGKHRVDDRPVTNGIFYVLRTGAPWRATCPNAMAPTPRLQPVQPVGQARYLAEVFEELARRSPQSLQLIDSSIVRAHQHAAGGKKGARITPSAVLGAD